MGAFLALAIAGLAAGGGAAAGLYEAARVITWFVVIPLCAVTLASGVAIALTGPWGLLNHYWVVVKLAITVAATVGLIIHLAPIGAAATAAPGGPPTAARVQLIVASALALVLLAVALGVSTFQPSGRTKRGVRAQQRTGSDAA